MYDHLKYIEENTNVPNNKNKSASIILIVAYLGIWIFSLIAFWFFSNGSDAMGYSLLFLWGILPITTFVISILIGKNNYWGNWKWMLSLIFGFMYMLAEYATFSTANMFAFDKMNMPQFWIMIIGTMISLFGLGIGSGINHLKFKEKIKK